MGSMADQDKESGISEYAKGEFRVARMMITRTFLLDFLQLPKGTRLRQIFSYDPHTACFNIEIENSNLASVRDGEIIPQILPHIEVDTQDKAGFYKLTWPDLEPK